MDRGSAIDKGLKVFFIFSLCLICLMYGIIAAHFKWFPYPQIRDATRAVEALLEVAAADEEDGENQSEFKESVVTNHAGIDDGAHFLISGGPEHFANYHPDGCMAWLIDRQGKVRHTWSWKPEFVENFEKIQTIPGKSWYYVTGIELLPDGGLICIIQGKHTWPYATAILRIDKDSNLIWRKECLAHHWFSLTDDDKIILPTLRVVDGVVRIGNTGGKIRPEERMVLEDMIAIMTMDGEILEEHSLFDIMHDSGLIGLYQGATNLSENAFDKDPLHLNDVQLVGERGAEANDWLNADDLLVSFRSINTVAIIDRQTWLVKWYAAGTTSRQHSPRMLNDGVLVFDNRGGDHERGGTRMLKIDIDSRLGTNVFPKADAKAPEEVRSVTAGHLDLSKDASAAIMAVTHQETVFEIDIETGKVLWEYLCIDPANQMRRPIYTAKYVYDIQFPMNQAEVNE